MLFAYCSEAYGLIITIASETVEGATVGFSAIVSSGFHRMVACSVCHSTQVDVRKSREEPVHGT